MADSFVSMLESTGQGGQGIKVPANPQNVDIGKTLENIEAKAKPQLERMREAESKQTDALTASIKQGDEYLTRLDAIQRPTAPKMDKLPDAPDSQLRDPMQALGSMGSV